MRMPLATHQQDRIESCLPFVESLARRMASTMPHSIDLGDLVQDGVIGLIDAALRPRGIDVLNAAAVSYSPIIYWKKTGALIDQGLKFDEEVVFIDVSDASDDALFVWPMPDVTKPPLHSTWILPPQGRMQSDCTAMIMAI